MAGLGDFTGLLKQAQKVQAEIARVQAELKEKVVEGTAGGGAVTVRVSGNMDVLSVTIAPAVLEEADAATLEDLVLVATKQGIDRAREMAQAELGRFTGGMSIPGLL
ncbi:MAG: YbaB/EbfC family nucleoid-associated protein [Planctomycetota bacterium JB042]